MHLNALARRTGERPQAQLGAAQLAVIVRKRNDWPIDPPFVAETFERPPARPWPWCAGRKATVRGAAQLSAHPPEPTGAVVQFCSLFKIK